ncbi:MAG: polymer-forming cytoskeletal protein [Acidobacteria bacterium]|jgi:cytoskeletal protein CcmA (bactofilin family)|nr:polymer-forming cytoskeletal protein [Acidobacteriota bacterium]MCU0253566.1 polymer-forming cytoskeletal protein [Acidobacteriota bacterium]
MFRRRRRFADRFESRRFWTDELSYVGPGLLLEGALRAQGPVAIAGRVEGQIVTAGLVRILPGGLVCGPVEGLAALVEGRVEGSVSVHEAAEVATHAQIIGNLEGPSLAIAEGAYIAGRVDATARHPVIFVERRLPRTRSNS